MQVKLSEVYKYSHIRPDLNLSERELVVEFYWNGETWPLYLPDENGILIQVQSVGGPISGNYFAEFPNREDDIHFQFLDTLWQKGIYKGMSSNVRALDNAVVKLGVLIAQMVQNYHGKKGIPFSSDLITANVEHFLVTIRSIFDFLYESIVKLLAAHPSRKKKPSLPKKLSRFILSGNTIASTDDVVNKYDLPSDFVRFYVEQAHFFIQIRQLRDKIIHGSRQNIQTIFDMPRGYGFGKTEKPFSEFYEIKNNQVDGNIASLVPFLSHIMKTVIGSCDNLISSLFREYGFLPTISPLNSLYSRHPFNYYSKALMDTSNNQPVWFSDIIPPVALSEKLKLDYQP